ELAALAERLEAARDFPGRARRRRTLDVLRIAVGWKEAPEEAVSALARADARASFADLVLRAGHGYADSLPAVRDPEERERALEALAVVALGLPIREDGVAPPDAVAVKDVLRLA